MGIISRNKTIIIAVIVILVGIIWYVFSSSGSDSSSVITTDTTSVQDQSLVQSLLALRAITLSGAILSNPAFQTLKDDSTQIVAEPVGRNDPFQPLDASVSPSATTTQGAQIFKSRQQ